MPLTEKLTSIVFMMGFSRLGAKGGPQVRPQVTGRQWNMQVHSFGIQSNFAVSRTTHSHFC